MDPLEARLRALQPRPLNAITQQRLAAPRRSVGMRHLAVAASLALAVSAGAIGLGGDAPQRAPGGQTITLTPPAPTSLWALRQALSDDDLDRHLEAIPFPLAGQPVIQATRL